MSTESLFIFDCLHYGENPIKIGQKTKKLTEKAPFPPKNREKSWKHLEIGLFPRRILKRMSSTTCVQIFMDSSLFA